MESRLDPAPVSWRGSQRCLGLYRGKVLSPWQSAFKRREVSFLSLSLSLCRAREEAFGKCSLTSVNRVISSCFCVSCQTAPFFLSASNQSPRPSPSLPLLFFFLFPCLLDKSLSLPPPSLLWSEWRKVVVVMGVSQRKKERKKDRERREFLHCFFNMFNRGPGSPGAFVRGPTDPHWALWGEALGRRGLWENLWNHFEVSKMKME